MPRETGGHEVWITNTSASRTFSSIWTIRLSFAKRTTRERATESPRWAQIDVAGWGWEDPATTWISPCIVGLLAGARLVAVEEQALVDRPARRPAGASGRPAGRGRAAEADAPQADHNVLEGGHQRRARRLAAPRPARHEEVDRHLVQVVGQV